MNRHTTRKNVFINIQELQSEGISFTAIHTAMEIECFGQSFVRNLIFSQDHREEAAIICRQYLECGADAFITESKSFVSVWKAQQKPSAKSSYAEKQTTKVSQEQHPVLGTIKDMKLFLEEEYSEQNPYGGSNLNYSINDQQKEWWHNYVAN